MQRSCADEVVECLTRGAKGLRHHREGEDMVKSGENLGIQIMISSPIPACHEIRPSATSISACSVRCGKL